MSPLFMHTTRNTPRPARLFAVGAGLASALIAWGSSIRPALAAEARASVAAPPAPIARAAATHGQPAAEKLSYWDQGEARLFLSARLEAGGYVKPQVALGYGKPYWLWAGIEAFPMVTPSFAAAYAGLRGSLPFADLRVGARYSYSFDRSLLPARDHYDKEDVSSLHGARASYVALEAELTLTIPIPFGYLVPVSTLYSINGIEEGTYVYDESLRGILKPPIIWGNRLAYAVGIGHQDFIKVGWLVEWVVLPGRGADIWRTGPVGVVTITDHTEFDFAFSPVVSSPDSLGIWHGPFGVLGLVYRFATGDENPRFP